MDMPQKWGEELFEKLVQQAHCDINNYAAIFVTSKTEISASGVFVNTCGYEGILTAHHVAKPLLEEESFGLCISQAEHLFIVRSQYCEHVPIGFKQNYDDEGPDLSFIIIKDPKALATIKRLKSFCHLDNRDLNYFNEPIERMLWCISGSPYESAKFLPPPSTGGRLKQFSSFIGEATFKSHEQKGSFDYVSLIVPNGKQGYPRNYQGVSGGGVWIVPFTAEDDERKETLRTEIPILAGIAFYQEEVDEHNKCLVCHGFNSVYRNFRETLRNRRL